jgi:hypothetical protein
MAYLDTTTLTCPTCGLSAKASIVVGVGPGSKKGDIPYKTVRSADPFICETDDDGRKTGRVLCPTDGHLVWTDRPGRSASSSDKADIS